VRASVAPTLAAAIAADDVWRGIGIAPHDSLVGPGRSVVDSRVQPPAPRRLRVNLADLVDAFDAGSPELSAFLDLDTGEVIPVTAEVHRELEAIYEDLAEEPEDQSEEARRALFAAALEQRDLPNWMHELLLEADEVEGGLGTRFIQLPEADSREAYEDMEAFIETVTSPRLQDRLRTAIQGRGAFRRFKDVLIDLPAERERWFAFKNARVRERVLAWLASEGIEPITEAD
jgi:hypothetical protein